MNPNEVRGSRLAMNPNEVRGSWLFYIKQLLGRLIEAAGPEFTLNICLIIDK